MHVKSLPNEIAILELKSVIIKKGQRYIHFGSKISIMEPLTLFDKSWINDLISETVLNYEED